MKMKKYILILCFIPFAISFCFFWGAAFLGTVYGVLDRKNVEQVKITLERSENIQSFSYWAHEGELRELEIWFKNSPYFVRLSNVAKKSLKKPYTTVLHQYGDHKIFCSWNATEGLPYPYNRGSGIGFVALTALIENKDFTLSTLLQNPEHLENLINSFSNEENLAMPFDLEIMPKKWSYHDRGSDKDNFKCWRSEAEIPEMIAETSVP